MNKEKIKEYFSNIKPSLKSDKASIPASDCVDALLEAAEIDNLNDKYEFLDVLNEEIENRLDEIAVNSYYCYKCGKRYLKEELEEKEEFITALNIKGNEVKGHKYKDVRRCCPCGENDWYVSQTKELLTEEEINRLMKRGV